MSCISFRLLLLGATLLPSLYVVVGAAAVPEARSPDLCRIVAGEIPGRIDYPGSDVYNNSQSVYYSQEERKLNPSCIFRPNNTAEVSQFVKLVKEHGKKDGSGRPLPTFAIRGGGHMLQKGAANIDGGITVDLRGFSAVVLNKDKNIASIGGGAIWSDVYPQLERHNLTALGGRVPGIAVGGSSLGGTVNYLSRRHGFGCDNIYGYEIVLADGRIVYATATSYPDLWLALKGGLNNFGIVTRFDVATFPAPGMWGGAMQFPYTESVKQAQAEAFSNLMNPENFDDSVDMGVILGFQNPGAKYSVENSLFYVEPKPNPPVYREFQAINGSLGNNFAVSTVSGFVQSFGGSLPHQLNRTVEAVITFKNGEPDIYLSIIKAFEEETGKLSDIEGLGVQYLMQPHPVTNGTNSLGLAPDQKDLIMAAVTMYYPYERDDDRVMTGMKDMVAKQEALLKEAGLYNPFKYINYADPYQDPITNYGTKNVQNLWNVSRKYDPEGLFQTGVPGGFKLPEIGDQA